MLELKGKESDRDRLARGFEAISMADLGNRRPSHKSAPSTAKATSFCATGVWTVLDLVHWEGSPRLGILKTGLWPALSSDGNATWLHCNFVTALLPRRNSARKWGVSNRLTNILLRGSSSVGYLWANKGTPSLSPRLPKAGASRATARFLPWSRSDFRQVFQFRSRSLGKYKRRAAW